MTTLENEMKKRDISVYKLSQALEMPMGSTTRLARRIAGKDIISVGKLAEICEAITKISKQPLKVDDLKVEMDVVRVK